MNSELSIQRMFFVSLFLHLCVMVGAFISVRFALLGGARNREIFVPTVRVDIIGLPDLPVHQKGGELSEIRQEIQSVRSQDVYNEKAQEKLDIKKSSRPKKDVMSKLTTADVVKKLRALEGLERDVVSKKRDNLRKGNVKSEGVSYDAVAGVVGIESYKGVVDDRVRSQWFLPVFLQKRADLAARLVLFIDENGGLIRRKIVSSGNEDFDRQVLQALGMVLPFPPPPRELVQSLQYEGIELEFRP